MDSISLFQGSITVIHLLLAVLIIALVLFQGGNSGGMGAAFGGGNTEGVFGATGGSNFMQKLTLIFTLVFLLTSMFLGVMQSKEGDVGLLNDTTSTIPIDSNGVNAVAPVAVPPIEKNIPSTPVTP